MPATLLPGNLESSPPPAQAAQHRYKGQQQTDRWTDGWTGMESMAWEGWEQAARAGWSWSQRECPEGRRKGAEMGQPPPPRGPVLTVQVHQRGASAPLPQPDPYLGPAQQEGGPPAPLQWTGLSLASCLKSGVHLTLGLETCWLWSTGSLSFWVLGSLPVLTLRLGPWLPLGA